VKKLNSAFDNYNGGRPESGEIVGLLLIHIIFWT